MSIVTDHTNARIQAARRAFYGLQSSGVCCDGVTPKTLSHIYKVGIQPLLTYGCSAVNIDFWTHLPQRQPFLNYVS